MEVRVHIHAQAVLPPGEKTRYLWIVWIGDLVGHRSGLDVLKQKKKLLYLPETKFV
jgi:hypothetical protein